MPAMKTEFAILQAGGVDKLAGLLEITRQAIYQWGDQLPKAREYELLHRWPEVFGAATGVNEFSETPPGKQKGAA